MNSENDKLDAALAETVQRALRKPKVGQLEQLLANELSVALFNIDPLQKIRHILEACMVLNEDEKAEIFTAEEWQRIENLYRLAISFLNIVNYNVSPNQIAQSVPFCFSSKKAADFLSMLGCNNPEETYHFLMYEAAHPVNVQQYKALFINVAMPFTLQAMRRIVENFVSPETWTLTLQQARRQA